jgi:hypothetical protein
VGYAYSVGAPNLVATLPAPTTVAGGVLGLEYSSYDAIRPWCTAQEPLPDGLSRGGDDLVGVFTNVVFLRPGGTFGGVGQVRFHRE